MATFLRLKSLTINIPALSEIGNPIHVRAAIVDGDEAAYACLQAPPISRKGSRSALDIMGLLKVNKPILLASGKGTTYEKDS